MSTPDSSPPTAQQAATSFRFVGWFSFWFQVVLGVISAITLLFSGLFNRGMPSTTGTETSATGTGFGVFFAGIGLLMLAGSIYCAFRYTRLGRQLKAADAAARPKKAETFQMLKMGLTVSLVGMLVTLVAGLGFIGGLTIKISRTSGTSVPLVTPTQLINYLDILTMQAILVILLALFVGVAAPLWLMNRISR